MKTVFIESYPISDLNPAEYNPRKIEQAAFSKLCQSLKLFGVIKPVLLNADGTLIAGHQRTKALIANKKKFLPAIKLSHKLVLKDEARFNLYHNSIETDGSVVVLNGELQVDSYQFVEPKQIQIIEKPTATIVKEICNLITKYGSWGSIVADENGKVILNSDYARACAILRVPCLVYAISQEKAQQMAEFLHAEYGEYNYENLRVSNMNQTRCQMHRLRQHGKRCLKSTCYERIVLPNINKTQKILDFGEGQGDYRKRLQNEGFNILGYEPFLRYRNKHEMWIDGITSAIKKIEQSVKESGLFDVVILDSVINSVTSLEFEHFVLLTCNAFLKKNGVLYSATRNFVDRTKHKTAIGRQRKIEFLDKDGFSTVFREGMFTKQRFHSPESFKETLLRYFKEVEIQIFHARKNQINAICRTPKPFPEDKYKIALSEELNADYNGVRHEKHLPLLRQIMLELRNENRIL